VSNVIAVWSAVTGTAGTVLQAAEIVAQPAQLP
jgi:hypothetical protein